jgi:hypothetical protein
MGKLPQCRNAVDETPRRQWARNAASGTALAAARGRGWPLFSAVARGPQPSSFHLAACCSHLRAGAVAHRHHHALVQPNLGRLGQQNAALGFLGGRTAFRRRGGRSCAYCFVDDALHKHAVKQRQQALGGLFGRERRSGLRTGPADRQYKGQERRGEREIGPFCVMCKALKGKITAKNSLIGKIMPWWTAGLQRPRS